jgi:hypothetical protein
MLPVEFEPTISLLERVKTVHTLDRSYYEWHADVGISYVQDVIHQKCNNHYTRLETHENPLLKQLLLREENRRLKRNWPIDLIWGTGDSPLDDSSSRHCDNHNISL